MDRGVPSHRTRRGKVKLFEVLAILGVTLLGARKAKAMTTPPPPQGAPPRPPGAGPGPTIPAGVKPGPIIASFPESDWRARNDMVLNAVIAGRQDPIAWRIVTSVGEGPLAGYELDVPVMSDALKIEGVRLSTSYNYAQWIADVLGPQLANEGPLIMVTPWLDAIIFEQSDAPLRYTTSQELSNKGVTSLTSQMVEVSKKVDSKLAAFAADTLLPSNPIVGNPGKNWVITKRFTEPGVHPESLVPHSQAAANQGFYPQGDAWNPIQYRGLAHGLDHVDYSQVLRFMAPTSYLREPGVERDQVGIPVSTSAILQDENLGPLLSGPLGVTRGKYVGEGHLAYDRHPAVPPRGASPA